jgi:hypothetical protein
LISKKNDLDGSDGVRAMIAAEAERTGQQIYYRWRVTPNSAPTIGQCAVY